MQDVVRDEVFELTPTFTRGVVVARGLCISNHNSRIDAFLREVEAKRTAEGAQLLNEPRLSGWDDAHRKFGSNPKHYPPAIRSLLDRVRRGKTLPYINDGVAVFNAVSLKYLFPCGGDDLDAITPDAYLGAADGGECFTPLGGSAIEHPEPGEVIYHDGDRKVMCRRWNWRNGDQTKITTKTRNMLINIDGLGDSIRSVIEEATEEMALWFEYECGAATHCDVLHTDRRRIVL